MNEEEQTWAKFSYDMNGMSKKSENKFRFLNVVLQTGDELWMMSRQTAFKVLYFIYCLTGKMETLRNDKMIVDAVVHL